MGVVWHRSPRCLGGEQGLLGRRSALEGHLLRLHLFLFRSEAVHPLENHPHQLSHGGIMAHFGWMRGAGATVTRRGLELGVHNLVLLLSFLSLVAVCTACGNGGACASRLVLNVLDDPIDERQKCGDAAQDEEPTHGPQVDRLRI